MTRRKKFIWLPNMTKRTADVAGLANLITPSGKRVRELLSSVKKRVTPNAADTNEDVLFLSPLNQVQFRADTDGEGNDLREGGASVGGSSKPVCSSSKKSPLHLSSSSQKENFKLPYQPTLRLHNEMLNFSKLISPTEEENNGRKSVLDLITRLAVQIWGEKPNKNGKIKDIKVEVFGSFLTGLCLPTSDIDIVIFGALDLYTTVKKALYQLAGELKRLQIVSFMEVIDSARVPIIKFTHINGTNADICFDQPSGPRMGKLIRNMLDVVPGLRTIILVLKYFLLQRELNEVYKGGVGSFMLQIMTIASIQYHARLRWYERYQEEQACATNTSKNHARTKRIKQLRRSMKNRPAVNLGVMLLEFLEFYGIKLNFANVGISVRGSGKLYNKKDKGFFNALRPNMLSIENPEEPSDDLAKSSYRFQNVRSAFAHSFYILSKKMLQILEDGKKKKRQRRASDNGNGNTSLLSLLIDVSAAINREGVHSKSAGQS